MRCSCSSSREGWLTWLASKSACSVWSARLWTLLSICPVYGHWSLSTFGACTYFWVWSIPRSSSDFAIRFARSWGRAFGDPGRKSPLSWSRGGLSASFLPPSALRCTKSHGWWNLGSECFPSILSKTGFSTRTAYSVLRMLRRGPQLHSTGRKWDALGICLCGFAICWPPSAICSIGRSLFCALHSRGLRLRSCRWTRCTCRIWCDSCDSTPRGDPAWIRAAAGCSASTSSPFLTGLLTSSANFLWLLLSINLLLCLSNEVFIYLFIRLSYFASVFRNVNFNWTWSFGLIVFWTRNNSICHLVGRKQFASKSKSLHTQLAFYQKYVVCVGTNAVVCLRARTHFSTSVVGTLYFFTMYFFFLNMLLCLDAFIYFYFYFFFFES